MAQTVQDVMMASPKALASSATVVEAARLMREHDIGDVLVQDDGRLCGIVTDRDIVVRGLAEGRDPQRTPLAELCSADLVTVDPDTAIDAAARIMRERAVRRLPVVRDGRPVGILSLGDLAIERDPDSTLADISAAPPND